MKPVVPPISTAATTLRAVAASPTVSDSRTPWMRRLKRSRPHVVGAQQVRGGAGLQAVAQVNFTRPRASLDEHRYRSAALEESGVLAD